MNLIIFILIHLYIYLCIYVCETDPASPFTAEASSFVFAQNKSQTGLEKHEGRMCIYGQMTLLIKERWDLYRYSVSSFCMGLYRRFSSCSRKNLSNHTSQIQLFGRRCS